MSKLRNGLSALVNLPSYSLTLRKLTMNIPFSFVILAAVLTFGQTGCAPQRSTMGNSPDKGNDTQMEQLGISNRIVFDTSRIIEEDAEWRRRSSEINVELSWTVLDDEESVGAVIRVVNEGGTPQPVFPIHPMHYILESRNSNGETRPLLAYPPLDPPLAKEGEMVLLYPRNVLMGVIAAPRSELMAGQDYRVSVHANYTPASALEEFVLVNLASSWIAPPSNISRK